MKRIDWPVAVALAAAVVLGVLTFLAAGGCASASPPAYQVSGPPTYQVSAKVDPWKPRVTTEVFDSGYVKVYGFRRDGTKVEYDLYPGATEELIRSVKAMVFAALKAPEVVVPRGPVGTAADGRYKTAPEVPAPRPFAQAPAYMPGTNAPTVGRPSSSSPGGMPTAHTPTFAPAVRLPGGTSDGCGTLG